MLQRSRLLFEGRPSWKASLRISSDLEGSRPEGATDLMRGSIPRPFSLLRINMATTSQRKKRKPYLAGQPGEDHMAEANALVNGDRQAAYGRPRDSYVALAKVWSGMLDHKLEVDLTPED